MNPNSQLPDHIISSPPFYTKLSCQPILTTPAIRREAARYSDLTVVHNNRRALAPVILFKLLMALDDADDTETARAAG
jgi:hypothetical protein